MVYDSALLVPRIPNAHSFKNEFIFMKRTILNPLNTLFLALALLVPAAGWSAGIPTEHGNGLSAQYSDETGARVTRLDSTVDFDLGVGRPHPQIDSNNFSITWSGWVRAEFS